MLAIACLGALLLGAAPPESGVFASLGLPDGAGLQIRGKFDVPFYARLFTNGKFSGSTRFQASDGERVLIVARASARIAGKIYSRDAILALRPDPKRPAHYLFSGRMIKELDPAELEKIRSMSCVGEQIDALLALVSAGDRAKRGAQRRVDSTLALDSAASGVVRMTRLDRDGSRGDPASFERQGETLSVRFKKYQLEISLGASPP